MAVKRFAFPSDLESIRAIWSAAFPEDTAADCDRFLQTMQLSEECLLAEEDGTPVSMECMLPVSYGARRLQYIYAAATLPSHRGRGVFADLLRTALTHAREQGMAASFLRPAQPSLEAYYARFGYRPWSGYRLVTGETMPSNETVTRLSPEAFVKRRAALLPSDSLTWEPRFVSYAASCGVALGTERGVALCETYGDTLFIKELLGDVDPAALGASVGCHRYEWRQSDGEEPFMMYLPLDEPFAAPYVGLALD